MCYNINENKGDIMVKRISKKEKRRLISLFLLNIIIILIIVFNISKIWFQIIEKKREYSYLNNEIKLLNTEELNLKAELIKLQDPDYIARYAREKFLYSRSGEIIIKIPEAQ